MTEWPTGVGISRRAWLLPIVLALFTCMPASAEEWSHRGSVGLLLAPYGEGRSARRTGLNDDGLRGGGLLGLTVAPGTDSAEWLLATTVSLFHPMHEWTLFAGRRSYFGYDEFKTFLDFSLFAQVRPYFSIGPRVGTGVQYDLGPLWGIWSGAFLQLGGGEGLLFTGSIAAGLQLRTYWLEN